MGLVLVRCQSSSCGAGPELWQDTAESLSVPQEREGTGPQDSCPGAVQEQDEGQQLQQGKIWFNLEKAFTMRLNSSRWAQTGVGVAVPGDAQNPAECDSKQDDLVGPVVVLHLWSIFAILPERKIANEKWQPDWKRYLGPYHRLGLLDFHFCLVFFKK